MFFLPCELRRLVVFVLFGSKNDNNNGFDMVGLNSLLYDYRRVVFSFFFIVLALLFLVACFILDEMFAY